MVPDIRITLGVAAFDGVAAHVRRPDTQLCKPLFLVRALAGGDVQAGCQQDGCGGEQKDGQQVVFQQGADFSENADRLI